MLFTFCQIGQQLVPRDKAFFCQSNYPPTAMRTKGAFLEEGQRRREMDA